MGRTRCLDRNDLIVRSLMDQVRRQVTPVIFAQGNTLGVGSSAKKSVTVYICLFPTKIEDSHGHDTIQFIRYLDYCPTH